MKSELWKFETKNYRAGFHTAEDFDLDLSWDEDGSVQAGLDNGELVAFGAIVTVTHKPAGIELGSDSLWGCVYRDVDEFMTGHRDPDPMNRNCTLMRAQRGDITICHYFPSLVYEAIANARRNKAQICAMAA